MQIGIVASLRLCMGLKLELLKITIQFLSRNEPEW